MTDALELAKRQCGDAVTPENAAFAGATRTCYDCWADDDISVWGYDGDAL